MLSRGAEGIFKTVGDSTGLGPALGSFAVLFELHGFAGLPSVLVKGPHG